MNDNYMEVLEQYEEPTVEVRRGRGAWICQRADGVKLLKEYRGTLKRLEFEERVLQVLKEQGISCVDQYIRNREGELLTTAGDGTKYIVKDWFLDRECNLRESREILFAVSRIARLHQALRQVSWVEDWDMGSVLPGHLDEEMERHNREMKRARTYMSNKRKKTDFELCVIHHFDEYYQQARKAQEGLELLRENGEQDQLFLCHGDLNQHHVLIGNDEVAFIEFNQMHLGAQMSDLYHFMRKVMEKHNWDEQLGLSMMESYERVLPLRTEDRACLYYLFLYPEKYWKQLNYYFNANKAWIPAKNVEKLMNINQQQEARVHFLSKIK